MTTARIDVDDPGHVKDNAASQETQLDALALTSLREALEQVAAARVSLPLRKSFEEVTPPVKASISPKAPKKCEWCHKAMPIGTRSKTHLGDCRRHKRSADRDRQRNWGKWRDEDVIAAEAMAARIENTAIDGFPLFGGLAYTRHHSTLEFFTQHNGSDVHCDCTEGGELSKRTESELRLRESHCERDALRIDWGTDAITEEERSRRDAVLQYYEALHQTACAESGDKNKRTMYRGRFSRP